MALPLIHLGDRQQVVLAEDSAVSREGLDADATVVPLDRVTLRGDAVKFLVRPLSGSERVRYMDLASRSVASACEYALGCAVLEVVGGGLDARTPDAARAALDRLSGDVLLYLARYVADECGMRPDPTAPAG